MKAKPKIYLETTLFNYYFDTDRDAHAYTVSLFKAIAAGKYEAFTSNAVIDELMTAPAEKRDAMMALVGQYGISSLSVDGEVEKLADAYIAKGIIPAQYRTDGIHIAVAAVNDMDFVVSLNFRGIVNEKTKRLTCAENVLCGYRPVEISSPMAMGNTSATCSNVLEKRVRYT